VLLPRTTGILIGCWVADSHFSFGLREGKSRSACRVAARATNRQSGSRVYPLASGYVRRTCGIFDRTEILKRSCAGKDR